MVIPALNIQQLGRIVHRDAREVWTHEAHHFTPWLLENIAQLNEAIGFEIELSGREEAVGPFAVDLYGREVQTGHPAIIENQLESTDHTHLGQLLTYAAGLKAGIVVWVSPHFRDEHRAALSWLNEITPQDVNFFGIEIEILEINGQCAANFKAVVQPNKWSAPVTAGPAGQPTPRMLAYQAFFADVLDVLKRDSPGITTVSRAPLNSWLWLSSGRRGIGFSFTFTQQKRFRVELYIDVGSREQNEYIFASFERDKPAIEETLGLTLEWDRIEGRRAMRIAAYYPGAAAITEDAGYLLEIRSWAVPQMIRFINVLRPRVTALTITPGLEADFASTPVADEGALR